MATFEGYERRIKQIEKCIDRIRHSLPGGGEGILPGQGRRRGKIVRGIQPIAFENAVWAYTLGARIALQKGCKNAAEAAEAIGIGLQAFCIPGSVADQRAGRASATAIWPPCCCARRRSASASWPAMSPSPPPKAPSASPSTANKVRKEPLRSS